MFLKQVNNLSAKYAFKYMIMLSEAKFFVFNTYFYDKNGLLSFNFSDVGKIENLTLSYFFLPIFIDKVFNRGSYRN